MAFVKKNWLRRIVQYPNRRKLVPTGTSEIYDVERSEGNISQKGDGFTVENMNDLEERIKTAVDDIEATKVKVAHYTFPAGLTIKPMQVVDITTISSGAKIINVTVYSGGGTHTLIYAGYSGSNAVKLRNVGTGDITPSASWKIHVFYI